MFSDKTIFSMRVMDEKLTKIFNKLEDFQAFERFTQELIQKIFFHTLKQNTSISTYSTLILKKHAFWAHNLKQILK